VCGDCRTGLLIEELFSNLKKNQEKNLQAIILVLIFAVKYRANCLRQMSGSNPESFTDLEFRCGRL
jgi:hypothetical protein